jgi:MHS family alpha-ketoglutarate permease-like MFS transporter
VDQPAPQTQARTASAHAVARPPRLLAVFSAAAGNLIEWYDWYIYTSLSIYFSHSFFPGSDRTVELLKTAGIFAVGSLMRPLGGWLLGWYADRHGRRAALTASVLLMSLGSLLIAVTPDYATLGVAAPALLLCARLLQGLSVGGEYGASTTYLSEIAPPHRRGFYSSLQFMTLVMGQLLALAVLVLLQQFLLSEAQIQAWGWRLPFVIGALGALLLGWLRRGMEEPEAFRLVKQERGSLLRRLLAHPRELLIVMGLTMGGTVIFTTFTSFMQTFLVNTTGFDARSATAISALALLIYMLLHPVVGLISDFVGRRAVLLCFGALGALLTVPLMHAIGAARGAPQAFVLVVCGLVIVSGYTAVGGIVKAELFPTEVRALGVGLPYGIMVALFGGSAPSVALWARESGHEPWYYWYVSILVAVSFVVYLWMPDTRRHSRIPTAST